MPFIWTERQAKGGGDRRPGTKKGDAYRARSAHQKVQEPTMRQRPSRKVGVVAQEYEIRRIQWLQ